MRGGHLEALADDESSDVPLAIRPSTETLKLLAGWPGGTAEAALDELVNALDQAIASTPAGEERSKVVRFRESLVGAARDIVIAYLEKKIGV